jgi:hypothetical protein
MILKSKKKKLVKTTYLKNKKLENERIYFFTQLKKK